MSEENTIIESKEIHENYSSELTIMAEVYEDKSAMPEVNIHESTTEEKEYGSPKHRISKIFQNFSNTYSKRHPVVNALLSMYLLMALLISLMTTLYGISMIVMASIYGTTSLMEGIFMGAIVLFFSVYYIYYMYHFVVANRKDAILYTHLGSIIIWSFVIYFFILLFLPGDFDKDDEGHIIGGTIFLIFFVAFILSLLLNTFFVGLVYLTMKIRKYGATAWTMLDVSHKRFRTKFDKICFYLFFIVISVSMTLIFYVGYRECHPKDRYSSHDSAKIGDYYYQDGTISSEILSDKTVVGVVFSLQDSKGGKHGQIVALNDISAYKMQWETGELKDYNNYPNYTWENRMAALNDFDGYNYVDCEKDLCLDINFKSLGYLEYEVDGISSWYVPTAGQWKSIIENLGKTKVDNMLRFDADVASRNLEKININPRKWYWTITEFDVENAWSIRIASGEFGSRTSKKNEAYVRPVANF